MLKICGQLKNSRVALSTLSIAVLLIAVCILAAKRLGSSFGKHWQRHSILSSVDELSTVGVGAYGRDTEPPYFGYVFFHQSHPQRLPPPELSVTPDRVSFRGQEVPRRGSKFTLAVVNGEQINFVDPRTAAEWREAFIKPSTLKVTEVAALRNHVARKNANHITEP